MKIILTAIYQKLKKKDFFKALWNTFPLKSNGIFVKFCISSYIFQDLIWLVSFHFNNQKDL